MSEISQIDNQRIAKLQLAKQRFEGYEQISRSKIQRIPVILRYNDEFAKYASPKIISFGPIHHGRKNLEEGEHYKLFWTSMYIEEYSKQTKQVSDQVAQSLLKTIKDKLGELKMLFTEDVIREHKNDGELAWMLFVDGCSLLHFLENIDRQHPEALKLKLDLMMYIWRDVILLENQLPRRLLELLSEKKGVDLERLMKNYVLRVGKSHRELKDPQDIHHSGEDVEVKEVQLNMPKRQSFKSASEPQQTSNTSKFWKWLKLYRYCNCGRINLIRPQFSKILRFLKFPEPRLEPSSETLPKPNHLLAFVHSFVKPIYVDHVKDGHENIYGRSRTTLTTYKNIRDLKAAGVRLRVKARDRDTLAWKLSNSASFTSKLLHGELILPELSFDSITPYFFWNMIAYEMCPDFPNELHFCSFFIFMNSLIESGEDVKELRLAGVIQNMTVSDEEVAKLFKNVGSGLPSDIFYRACRLKNSDGKRMEYIQLMNKMEKHYRNKWRTSVAIAASKYNVYFQGPWSIIAFVAALAALALTAVQTWYAIYPS